MSEMKLRQAKNEVAIEGLFSELDMTEGVTKPDRFGKTKEYVRGRVTVQVDQMIGNEREVEEIPVSFFITKYKNDGGVNPAYESITSLKNLKRKSVDGENADYIRLTSFGSIAENAFVSRSNGQLIDSWVINGSFFGRVAANPSPKAVFKTKIVIRNIEDETVDDIPTGRLKVRGIIVQYGGRTDVVDFVVEDKNAYNHIFKNFKEQDTIMVAGFIRMSIANTKTSGNTDGMIGQEVDFSSVTTVRRRELVITSVSPEALQDEEAYDFDAICDALNVRKERMDKMLENASQPSAAPAATTSNKRGW